MALTRPFKWKQMHEFLPENIAGCLSLSFGPDAVETTGRFTGSVKSVPC